MRLQSHEQFFLMVAVVSVMVLLIYGQDSGVSTWSAPMKTTTASVSTLSPLVTTNNPLQAPAQDVMLNPPIELNFKSRADIYALRKQYVAQHLEWVEASYEPSEEVFGQIEDGKPWWGIWGLSYYGAGKKSKEGPSFQSYFITNPYLLVGLTMGLAFNVADQYPDPKPIYPLPLSLAWQGSLLTARYDVTSFFNARRAVHDGSSNLQVVQLNAVNARDFGFPYLAIMEQGSFNIKASTNHSMLIKQFYHKGGSCGYPGGCNNLSPYQPEFDVEVTNQPARVVLKLWQHEPNDSQQPADRTVVLDLI